MTDNLTESKKKSLEARIEAILFVASGTVTAALISEILDIPIKEIEANLESIRLTYAETRGIALQVHGGRYQMTTAPEFAQDIEKFLGLEATARLSRAAIETLAIIAYRQQITRPGIDSIRGVNSDGVIKSLLYKGLIQEVGRAEGPGRPILFSTTSEFLQHFGMASLEQLPPYENLAMADESKNNGILKD